MKKPVATIHADTVRLEEYLRTLAVGAEATYAVLATVAQRPEERLHGVLRTARERLRKDGVVLGAVLGVGLKRLDDAETIAEGGRFVRGAVSKARRGVRTLAGVQDFDALPNPLKLEHNVKMAQAAMIHNAGRRAVRKQIAARVQGSRALDAKEAVAALSGVV